MPPASPPPPDAAPPPAPIAAPQPGTPRRGAATPVTGQRRVRLAMYLAFVVLALALVLQALNTQRLDDTRHADTELLEQAAAQRGSAQQLGRLSALLAAADDEPERQRQLQALQRLLGASARDAQRLADLLARQQAHAAHPDRPLGPALARWQAARERLASRSEHLVRLAAEDGGADLRAAAAAVQDEIEPAQAAAQALSDQVHEATERRARGVSDALRWGLAATLGLLVLLALLVVEPTARAVRRHGRRLREQATELRRLALVAEHTSALVMITDADDLIVWVNTAFVSATGWPLADAAGQRPAELLVHPQADLAVRMYMRQALQAGQGARHELLHRTRDGRELWLDVDLRALHDDAGVLQGFVRVCSDTTARVLQQAKLKALWAALPVGVAVLGPDGEIIDANREAERMLGRSLAELAGLDTTALGRHCLRVDGSPYGAGEMPAARTLATGQPMHNETMGLRMPDGELRWLLVNTQPQFDGAGQITGAVACFGDVTQSRELQERLHTSARTDELTRLPNRAVVMERLQQAVAHARRHAGYGFSVLFMDFDRFKQVNDTLGHSAGDALLRQIAQRLSLALRPGDAVARVEGPMAARLGGDEFVVVLDGVGDSVRAGHIAQRLLDELGEPYLLDNAPVQSSVSIGVVVCDRLGEGQCSPSDAELAEDVLRNADTAMYEAKRAGRGRWVLFDDSMHERVVRVLEIETDLRRALKDDELFVVYQPVVDFPGHRMSGVEALVRWRDPQRGLVLPAEFIPVAEECGLIDAVGALVLETACRQFAAWQTELGDDAPRRLAVNLSRAQLKQPGLVDEVSRVVAASGMQPGQLQLEVTESLAAQDEAVLATLRALKALGVRLALDDFGTGYSSLACLHQMPVDTVKIDRSFVQHAEAVEYHRVLIEATIRVARTMGMSTVAEGIETEGQARLMHRLTCDAGQGYLFSPPLEAAELARWARAPQRQAVDAA